MRARAAQPAVARPASAPPRALMVPSGASNQRLQAKLKVGPVDDPLEREADRIAERLVGCAPAPTPGTAGSLTIQRQPAPPPGSPPAPVVEPARPLVTTWEIDTKTDSQKLGKGVGEAVDRALDTSPGKAAQDAASVQLERDWNRASGAEKVLIVGAAIGLGGAALALLRAIPEGDDAPSTPEKTPKIKIGKDFRVQLELKLGWKDTAPDGTETQRRRPRIDSVTVSLFYSPEGPKAPPETDATAAEIARLQAGLAPFRPRIGDAGFAVDYATRRMLDERNRRPAWLPSDAAAARQREADRFRLDAGPLGPRPGVRLVPELDLGDTTPPGTVQRKCASCAAEEDAELRLKAAGPARGSADAAVAGLGHGTPLPAAERSFFEPRLGRDLSAVRVHADSAGASAIGARAFTLDRRIAFAPGEWRPGTVDGRRLIAHELAHVVQQERGVGRAVRPQPAPAPDDATDPDERDQEERHAAPVPADIPIPADAGPAGADAAPADTGTPAVASGGTAPGGATPAPGAAVTAGGHAAAPSGVAACPDAPQRIVIVVGCAVSPAAAPPPVEKAELPPLSAGRFGGDAERAQFAKELAQCHAARTAQGEVDKRYRAAVEAAVKQASAEAKQDTEAATKAATGSARVKAVADAKRAAAKKIADARAGVTRQNLATVTAELAAQIEDWLATDFDETMRGAVGRYGPGWVSTMQSALNRERGRISKEKNAKPKVAKGETAPPAKPAADIAAAIEAEMAQVRCDQREWALNRFQAVARGWAVARRERVDFLTPPLQPGWLPNFAPTYNPPAQSRVNLPGTKGMAGVAPEMADFLAQLSADAKAAKVPSFTATNRAGHGGGSVSEPRHFAGKGFSADINISAPNDQRGFWQPGAAVAFLLQLDATAQAMGARWNVLYDDFRVAQAVNAAAKNGRVGYMATSSGGQLNWHGPDPLILHFHLDLEIPQKPPAAAGAAP